MTFKHEESVKAFHIDSVNTDIDFEAYTDENVWLGNPYIVFLTKTEVNKLKDFKFNPNTTNSRSYNKGFLKAFLGKQIEHFNRD